MSDVSAPEMGDGVDMWMRNWFRGHRTMAAVAALIAALAATRVLIGTDAANVDQRRVPGGEVRRVSGDRIKLKDGRDIEFAAIRLPFDHEPYAEKARQTLEKWVHDEGVRLSFDEEWGYKDDRLLAYVFANDTFINERMAREGLAFVKLRAGNRMHAARLLKAQADARDERNGMWLMLKPATANRVLGDEQRGAFHRPDCVTLAGNADGIIELNSSVQALDRGMAPCGKCRPME